jgi:hypothetical protein
MGKNSIGTNRVGFSLPGILNADSKFRVKHGSINRTIAQQMSYVNNCRLKTKVLTFQIIPGTLLVCFIKFYSPSLPGCH